MEFVERTCSRDRLLDMGCDLVYLVCLKGEAQLPVRGQEYLDLQMVAVFSDMMEDPEAVKLLAQDPCGEGRGQLIPLDPKGPFGHHPLGLSRLSFLRVALQQYGISRKELAEKLELHYMGVNRWFKVDDIAVSYLYEIAQLYGLQVKVKAVALPPDAVK